MAGQIVLGNLVIDHDRYEVWVEEKRVGLTFLEFELLMLLARNAGKVVARDRLIRTIWGAPMEGQDRKLTVHMSRLRKKLERSQSWHIQTITKRGYALMNPNSEPRASPEGDESTPLSQTGQL